MTTNRQDAEHVMDSAKARADLLRRAQAQGVKPFGSLEDFAGAPEILADFDVAEFLEQIREDRDRHSGGRTTNGDPGH